MPLRASGNFESSGDVELFSGMGELADLLVGGKDSTFTVDERAGDTPAVPQCPHRIDQFVGARVSL